MKLECMKLEAEGCITSVSLVFMKLTLAGFQYAVRRGEMKHSSFSWCAADFLHSLGMLAAAELRGDSQGPAPQAGGNLKCLRGGVPVVSRGHQGERFGVCGSGNNTECAAGSGMSSRSFRPLPSALAQHIDRAEPARGPGRADGKQASNVARGVFSGSV